jgi:hypothetical protein
MHEKNIVCKGNVKPFPIEDIMFNSTHPASNRPTFVLSSLDGERSNFNQRRKSAGRNSFNIGKAIESEADDMSIVT